MEKFFISLFVVVIGVVVASWCYDGSEISPAQYKELYQLVEGTSVYKDCAPVQKLAAAAMKDNKVTVQELSAIQESASDCAYTHNKRMFGELLKSSPPTIRLKATLGEQDSET